MILCKMSDDSVKGQIQGRDAPLAQQSAENVLFAEFIHDDGIYYEQMFLSLWSCDPPEL